MARKTTTTKTTTRTANTGKAAAAIEIIEDPPASQPPEPAPAPASTVHAIQLRRLPVSQIKRAKYNPRKRLKPGDRDYERLKHSIRTFGYVDPLVWNERTGNLVGGHQRLQVMLDEGVTEVDVSVVDKSDADEKALNIALNKIEGEWDKPALLDLLLELERTPDADLSASGFDPLELEALMAEVRGTGDGDGGPDDRSDADLDGASQLGDAIAFRIIVDCDSERHQRDLLRRFESEGLACRALMS